MKMKPFKAYRVNVVLSFSDYGVKHRELYLSMLKDFGKFFQMECVEVREYPFVYEDVSCPPLVSDIVFYRSTRDTQIERKAFQKLIGQLFSNGPVSPFDAGVGCQYQIAMKRFPWPSEK